MPESVLRDGRLKLEAVVAADALKGVAGGTGVDSEGDGCGVRLAVGGELDFEAALGAGGEMAAVDGGEVGVAGRALRGLCLEVDEAGSAEAGGETVGAVGAAGVELGAKEAEEVGVGGPGFREPGRAPADAGFAALEVGPGDVDAEE